MYHPADAARGRTLLFGCGFNLGGGGDSAAALRRDDDAFFALLLWLGGMKYTEAGSAAIINQTSTVFILVLASIFLKEPFTARRWAAAGLAIVGILLVTFG